MSLWTSASPKSSKSFRGRNLLVADTYTLYNTMIHSNTSRPLSEAFYQKLVRAVEGSADRDAFVWNQEGSGVLLLDEGALEDVLMTLFSIHLQTFRKMMMMYGFRKTISEVGEE